MSVWWKCNCGAPVVSQRWLHCHTCSRNESHGNWEWEPKGKYPEGRLIVTDEEAL